MKRRTISLTDKQDKAFHKLADEQGLGFSEVLRRALDDYLRKEIRYAKDNQMKITEAILN